MTLFATLQSSANALNAASLGLQVTGNNVQNSSTPGYIRENINLAPSAPQQYGGLVLGTGVQVQSVTEQIDRFLEERLRNANSDLSGSTAQQDVYTQLESLTNALGSSNLGTSLTSFFGGIQNVLNQPDSASLRSLAVRQGGTLASAINNLAGRTQAINADLNRQIGAVSDQVNSLITEIANLNVQIAQVQGLSSTGSDAVGLRDKRTSALGDLSKLVDIRTTEQADGQVAVYSGGDFLVFQGERRTVAFVHQSATNPNGSLQIQETGATLTSSGGTLGGLLVARDGIVAGYTQQLDSLSQALIQEFNKVYSSGQGLTGYSTVTSEFGVSDPNQTLDQAGLKFAPVNGAFQIQVKNGKDGSTKTTTIHVDLNGLDQDSSLTSLATQISAIPNVTATVTPDNKLRISATDPTYTFSFSHDSSGVLASLGINTFFSGSSAADIGINPTLAADPQKFAASTGGVGVDANNAQALAGLLTTPLASQNQQTLAQLYDHFVAATTNGAAANKATVDGFQSFQKTLQGQYLAVTSVNLDEETVKMLTFQRMYQASAKVISTVNQMLDTLLKI